jgi:2-keto-4-pentenoate hydratase
LIDIAEVSAANMTAKKILHHMKIMIILVEIILMLESDWLIEITEVSSDNTTADQKIASNENCAYISTNYPTL